MEQFQNTPSFESLEVLECLRTAVHEELEKKRKLGHYYVTWEDGKIVMHGDDAPETDHK